MHNNLTLAARGLEEPCASFPDFCDNHQFHIIYCVSSHLCTLFRRISDSRFTWIHDFEEYLTESVGPVPFFAQYHVQTDRQTYRRTDRQTHGRTHGQTHRQVNLGGAG